MKVAEPIRCPNKVKELLALAKKDSDRNYLYILVSLYTGFRSIDIRKLKLSDFYNEDGSEKMRLVVKENKTKKIEPLQSTQRFFTNSKK